MNRRIYKPLAVLCILAISVTILPFLSAGISKAEDVNYGLENPKLGFITRDIVEFGRYIQEDTNHDGVVDLKDEKTPIRWQVLEKDGDEWLLLSDKILDMRSYENRGNLYNTYYAEWKASNLRTWLNNDFLNSAFTDKEIPGILYNNSVNSEKNIYGIDGGDDSAEQIFLLSVNEVKKYGFDEQMYTCDPMRVAKVDDYVAFKGKSYSKDDNTGIWWLRSPGKDYNHAVYIKNDGAINYEGGQISSSCGIRPALRVRYSNFKKYIKDAGKVNVAINAASWDTVLFGTYGGNSLVWRVLKADGNDAFLISESIIDFKSYSTVAEKRTWEVCTLRRWLNGDFYDSAFTNSEKVMIKDSKVVNEDSPYGRKGGGDTIDKVYLLSASEAANMEYGFPDIYSYHSRSRVAYSYAGPVLSAGDWWLRSPGIDDSICAALVDVEGNIINYGANSAVDIHGVRPVLHIDLSSDAWTKCGKVFYGDIRALNSPASEEKQVKDNIEGKADPKPAPADNTDKDSTGQKTAASFSVKGLKYKVLSDNKSVSVLGTAGKSTKETVNIPKKIKYKGETYKVTEIAANAFKGDASIKKVILGKNITKIGNKAFVKCKNLKVIKVKSKKKIKGVTGKLKKIIK